MESFVPQLFQLFSIHAIVCFPFLFASQPLPIFPIVLSQYLSILSAVLYQNPSILSNVFLGPLLSKAAIPRTEDKENLEANHWLREITTILFALNCRIAAW
jgi:hypothetical protein